MELVVPFIAKEFKNLTRRLYQDVMVRFFLYFSPFWPLHSSQFSLQLEMKQIFRILYELDVVARR